MSMISQSTQDSGSASLDSDTKFDFRSRCQYSLESVQQRLDYSKQMPEALPKEIVESKIPQNTKLNVFIALTIVFFTLSALSFVFYYSRPSSDQNTIVPIPIDKNSIEKLFDPVQVNYIKSYEESAVGKYFYLDLLAEKYFNKIVEQLKQAVWMEEEVIVQYLDHIFKQNENDSYIIKKKIWKLRDKCNDIEVTTSISNKVIWKYKNCFCK
ncbi:hypothetical protein ABPG72_021913 [Tetrahymena utriculariae]